MIWPISDSNSLFILQAQAIVNCDLTCCMHWFTVHPTFETYFELRFDLLYTTLQGHLKLLHILIHYLPDTPKLSWTTIWPIVDTNSLFILWATQGYCELRMPNCSQWLTLHHSLQLFWTTIWPIAHTISLFVWQCKANDNFHLLLTLIFSVQATIQSYFKLRVDLLHTIIYCSPHRCKLRFDLLHTPTRCSHQTA